MAKVKDSIEEIYKNLQAKDVNCVIEYNQGNHFKDVEKRIAKGLSWLIKKV